jgi:hypothetical protein
MRSDGRGSIAISRRGFSCDDVVTQAQEFAAAGCEAMSDTASQRPQYSYRIEPVERIFF